MQKSFKTMILGLILGFILGFPLGINFGRDEPLWSNPFKDRTVAQKMGTKLKSKTGEIVDTARDKLHDATRRKENKEN